MNYGVVLSQYPHRGDHISVADEMVPASMSLESTLGSSRMENNVVCLSWYFHCALLPVLLLDVSVFVISSHKAHVKWASVLFSHQRSDSYSN